MQKILSGEKLIYSSGNSLEKEFEFILPEYLPGISRIVRTIVCAEKRDFSLTPSSADCGISLKISVIYISELGGKIKNATFYEGITIPMRDSFTYEGTYTAVPSCSCTGVSSTPLSARKVYVKCSFNAAVSIYAPSQTECFDGEGNDSLCLLREKQVVCVKRVLREEFLEHEAQITIDDTKPAAGEIVYASAGFSDITSRASDGVLEVEGVADIYVLYEISEDDNEADNASYALCSTQAKVSSRLECDKITADCTPFVYLEAISAEPSVSFDVYGSNKSIALNLKYSISGFVCNNEEYELVTDAFSERFEAVPEYTRLGAAVVKNEIHMKDTFSVPVRADMRGLSEISFCSIYVHSVSVEHYEGRLCACARSIAHITGANERGEIMALDIPVTLHIPFTGGDVSDSFTPDIILNISKCSAAVKEGQLTIEFEGCVDGIMTEHIQKIILSGLSEDENNRISRNKGEFFVYYPAKDDTLWSIAKRYCVRPEKIAEAGKLADGDISKKRAVLIPR